MLIAVHLKLDVARSLHKELMTDSTTVESKPSDLLSSIESLGLTLEPMHPNIDNPWLLPYFKIEIRNEEEARLVLERLQQFGEVEAAYLKPEDAPP